MSDNSISERKKRISVLVDAELERVIPGFIEDWKQEVNAMRLALDRGELETIRTIGHKMKGTGATCGFDTISDRGTELEAAVKAMNTGTIKKTLDMLASYLEQVEVVFE